MRELERDPSQTRLAVIGPGRLGTALARALGSRAAGSYDVIGPLGRGADGRDAEAVVLCVPDGEIAAAASLIAPGRLVGHCAGAQGLECLSPHEAFLLHPLMTVVGPETEFSEAGAAVDGSTDRALAFAHDLADALGMRPVRIAPEDRALYHAAGSMASNFLVTLEAAAERHSRRGRTRAGAAGSARPGHRGELGGPGARTGPHGSGCPGR